MKRSAAKVVVFLLLGAIVNVAMAWGCALWMRESIVSQTQDANGRLHAVFGSGEYRFSAVTLGSGVGIHRRLHAGLATSHDNSTTADAVHECLAGLPMYALAGETYVSANDADGIVVTGHGSFAIPETIQNRLYAYSRFLPLHPIWHGFAINTIFYAAILWMMFAMPFVLRRRRWIKRGLCPACAYPVGSSPVCTECGGPIGKRPNV